MSRGRWSVQVRYTDPDRPDGQQTFIQTVMLPDNHMQSVMNPDSLIASAAIRAYRDICLELYPDDDGTEAPAR